MKNKMTFFDAVMASHGLKAPCIAIWIKVLGKAPEWSDMTDENLRKYRTCLENDTKLPHSRLEKMRYLLNRNKDSVPSKNVDDILSTPRNFECKTFALTYEQMDKLVNYVPVSDNEGFVWRIFIIQMYTGARYEDALNINSDNITEDGGRIFYTKSNGIELSVPLNPKATKAIISKFHVNSSFSNKQGQYYAALKSLFKKLGFTEDILIKGGIAMPMHEAVIPDTALCTFASRLYHDGLEPREIMQYMGVKTLKGVRTHIYGYNKRTRKDNTLFTK